jgi:uracil-DNA glycosylase
MADAATMIPASTLASAMAWWRDAGVDCLVEEVPAPWLGRGKLRPDVPVAAPQAPAPQAKPHLLPESLDDLIGWLMTGEDVPGAGPPSVRVSPEGDRNTGMMALIDMPEAGDAAAGKMLSGESGILFDKMLSALTLDRSAIWLGSVAPDYRPGAMTALSNEDRLSVLARHHVGLVAPKRLWLMGDTASRAILGMRVIEAKGRKHIFNHKGITVAVVATYHPRFLLQRPERKREVWEDMQRLIEEVE